MVLGPVEHQGPRRYVAESRPQRLTATLEDRVVRHGRLDVDGSVDDAAAKSPHLLLAGIRLFPRTGAGPRRRSDDGLPVPPSPAAGTALEVCSQLVGHRWRPGPPGLVENSVSRQPVGVVEYELFAIPPPSRFPRCTPGRRGGRRARRRRPRSGPPAILRSARLIGDRLPRVAKVVPIRSIGPDASRSQNSSSHQSIELAAPAISRIAGLSGSPKVWTQSSTPFAGTIVGCEVRTE